MIYGNGNCECDGNIKIRLSLGIHFGQLLQAADCRGVCHTKCVRRIWDREATHHRQSRATGNISSPSFVWAKMLWHYAAELRQQIENLLVLCHLKTLRLYIKSFSSLSLTNVARV